MKGWDGRGLVVVRDEREPKKGRNPRQTVNYGSHVRLRRRCHAIRGGRPPRQGVLVSLFNSVVYPHRERQHLANTFLVITA